MVLYIMNFFKIQQKYIPFNKPAFVGNERKYIEEAIRKGHRSGDGFFTRKCHNFFEKIFSVKKALLTTSCTHALEMTAILLNVKADDEIITTPFTFVSTVNAFVMRGAKPVFVDIRDDTFNINENLIEAKITRRTKAIVVVHYAGVGCNMDKILSIARKHKIPVVEDNAHGLFGKYKGKLLGTFGTFAAQSFHETKNFSCGEGGALFINDPAFIERAEIVREKGTDRSKFFRGERDKYTWVDIGSSYLPSDICAAILYAQLEKHSYIQNCRKKIWQSYYRSLQKWAKENSIVLPYIPEECEQSFHMFYLLMPSLKIRQNFINYLKSKNIMSVFHYIPLHLSPMGASFGGKKGDYPVAEDISERIVRLPFFTAMNHTTHLKIIQAILDFKLK